MLPQQAGSTELRADGSFREWTIFNQGPAGQGKYGLVDDVYMGFKVDGKAEMLRTTPPRWADQATDGAASLTFSGTYPVTRLVVGADTPTRQQAPAAGGGGGAVTVAAMAYSTLKPTSLKDSAYPAIALSLTVNNPTAEAKNVSFMFTVPMGAWTDCARSGHNGTPHAAATHQGCMHACTAPVRPPAAACFG